MKRTYNFGPDQSEAIDRLSDELGIDKTDVLTNGLRLFRTAVAEARRGNRIGIVRDEKVVVSCIIGPWSDVEPVPA